MWFCMPESQKPAPSFTKYTITLLYFRKDPSYKISVYLTVSFLATSTILMTITSASCPCEPSKNQPLKNWEKKQALA